MLQIEKCSLYFGDRPLFDGISATINPGERIGLVGPNGAGKSTLLKLISGEMEPDGGRIRMAGDATVGYLPQDGVEPEPGRTVYEEVEAVFKDVIALRQEQRSLQEKLDNLDHDSPEHKKALERFGIVQHALEQAGAYSLESSIQKVLKGLGFSDEDALRPVTEFSGGWLMRVALAKLLLKQPTYLLLDEPTNHLDIESLRWIEKFLISYDGTVLMVSHDRAFLNSVTERTLALSRGELRDYAGNYAFYEKKYAEELEQLKKEYEQQQKEIKQTQEFIDRFRYKATKAKQVQSRIKQLEKMELIEIEQEQSDISFRFPPPDRSGQIVMRLSDIVKSYGENRVFDGINYDIERGDKVAVVGPNGAGKSTFIRILAGIEPFDSGEREVGYNVTPGYFAQHQADELQRKNSALEEMRLAGSRESETRLRTILGCFLFEGDDVFKKVGVLSGGEKSRVALAKMLLNPGNFLIFDEPTNHLDMQSKQILQQALIQFEGTLMIVSHDRDFLDPIVNKTLEIRPGEIKTWLGDLSYYLEKTEDREKEEEATKSGNQSDSQKKLSRKEERRIEAERRNALSRKLKPLKKRLEDIESDIAAREQRKEEIKAMMAESHFYDNSDKVKKISLEYENLKMELAEKMHKWEEIAGRIEFVESEYERKQAADG